MKRFACFNIILILAVFILVVNAPAFCEEQNYTFQKNVMIPMRDGIRLAANIFTPKGDGEKYPVILVRSPYGKSDEKHGGGIKYASNGYVYVIQDCRGKGDSEGVWEPFRYDQEDGFDTQEWIGQQPWCNGKIGTSGGSYVGWTQWASAPNSSKYLKAMAPKVPFTNAYNIMYTGGAYQLSLSNGWGVGVSGEPADLSKVNWDVAWKKLPLNRWEEQFGIEVFYLRDWVKHNTYDEYWKQHGIDDQYSDITVPILNMGGWYDIFSRDTLEQVTRVRHESKNPYIRRNQFCIIGPWKHGIDQTKCGELDFGEAARIGVSDFEFKWNEYWLKDKITGVEDWPAYYLFVMGANKWRGEHEWPLARTEYTKVYLHSDGNANTLNGDGVLSKEAPQSEKADNYTYDPENPVPTHGGNNLFGVSSGPYDQSEIEKRRDVLVYTSDKLEEAVEVTGPVKLVLYASSDAKDTDFTGKLIDVHPDGKAYNLCEGIIRARFRNSKTELELIEPGKIYKYEIDMWVTSNLFKAGHKIRLEISSSNFPRFDRNPNSGKTFANDTETQLAHQIIHHSTVNPSHLVLPVIPRGE